MTEGLERLIEMLSRSAAATDDAQKRRIAIGNWAAMVGALILARMSENSDLSNEISERDTRLAQLYGPDRHGTARVGEATNSSENPHSRFTMQTRRPPNLRPASISGESLLQNPTFRRRQRVTLKNVAPGDCAQLRGAAPHRTSA